MKNQNLNQTIDLTNYTTYLTNKSKSLKTIKDYKNWIIEYLTLYPTLSRENILSFKKHLQNKNQASSSINAKLSALKNYNEYLVSINQINSLLIISDDFITIQKKAISPAKYDIHDVEKVLKKVSSKGSKRDITLAYLLSNTGIRRSEAMNAKISHFNFDEGIFKIIGGKGEKDRDIYLNDEIISMIKDYINTERKESQFANSPYLFITTRSAQMNENTVNKIMAKYSKINPHQFRHVWASNAYDIGWKLNEIGSQLGHSSTRTTDIYANISLKEMRKKVNNMTVGF
jgi:site-specific recombinase XerD